MSGCCNNRASDIDDVQSATGSTVTPPSKHFKDDEKSSEPGCCVGSSCGCDDTCFDELARVICADDDTHLHDGGATNTVSGDTELFSPNGVKNSETVSDHTFCDKDANSDKCCVQEQEKIPGSSTAANAGGKRPTMSPTEVLPKNACGEHRSIARNRYNDTLAAFGCVCKALLARGLKSCCTSSRLTGKVLARSGSNSSKKSLCKDRSCQASCCGASQSSGQSSCVKTALDGDGPVLTMRSLSYRGHARDRPKSRSTSVDSCCRDGGCDNGIPPEDVDGAGDEKSEHISINMAEKHSSADEHAILVIKGMTCTGCENKLIRTLRNIPTIRNAKTSLVLSRAEFDFDGITTDIKALTQLIEQRSGFSAEVVKLGSTRDLLLAIPRSLQEAFLSIELPQGIGAVFRFDKDSFFVTYDPGVVGARRVLELYESFTPTLAPEPPDPSLTAGVKHLRALSLRAVVSVVLTIPVLIMTWAPLPPHPRAYSIASLVLATIVQVAITGPFYVSSFKSLVFSRLVETELLIVLSTTAAYVYSVVAFAFEVMGRPLASGQFFETSTLLVTLIMIGQLISAVARQRAIEAISIRSLQEHNACVVLPDGSEVVLDARLLQHGDIFKILPDSTIITDGEVMIGSSTVDESMMTGESLPVEKAPGSAVVAGTLNGPSTLFIKATRLPGENTISEIAGMVDDARFSRARVQEAVDRICGWFVPVVLVLSLVTFAVWMAVGVAVRGQSRGQAVVTALTYAIAVLAVSCPCAIGLAVPMVILIAGGVGAKLGLVFKAATTIEQARKVTHVVLDKTGTVTQGKLSIASRFMDETVGFNVASALTQLVATSRHPVARAVAADLVATANPHEVHVEDVEMVTGKGIRGTLLGQSLCGGSARWLNLESHPTVQGLLDDGLTTFCVLHGDRLIAAFGLSDTLRTEATSVIQSLTSRKIKISLLSGDHPAAVTATARSLGIPAERVRAGCLPVDKQAYIKGLISEGETVLFCGDGTNDAVALAQAAIGVHLHTGEGAGVAASTAADVVLTHPSLAGILTLLELSDAVARRIRMNFVWAGVYNLVAILLAAGAFVDVRIPPAYAGLGEVVSVVPVVLVALQLKWFKTSV